jgi:hypothetical protein
MSTYLESRNIEQLLAEADELIQRINSVALNEMIEEQRLQFEIHVQNLKRIKSEVQSQGKKKKISMTGSGAEGVHEAILDIVKAMQGLKRYLS